MGLEGRRHLLVKHDALCAGCLKQAEGVDVEL